jgi:hypothetical protein
VAWAAPAFGATGGGGQGGASLGVIFDPTQPPTAPVLMVFDKRAFTSQINTPMAIAVPSGFNITNFDYTVTPSSSWAPGTQQQITWSSTRPFKLNGPTPLTESFGGMVPLFSVTGGSGSLTLSEDILDANGKPLGGSSLSQTFQFSVPPAPPSTFMLHGMTTIPSVVTGSYTLELKSSLLWLPSARTDTLMLDPPSYGADLSPVASVPEPASLTLLGASALGLGAWLWRRRPQAA